MNDSSIAFCLNCYGHKILLTGDSTFTQWREHKRQMSWDNITNLKINSLKAPHHGSKYDNNEELYEYCFDFNENREAKHLFISADGIRHPDKEVFDLINKFELIPHCTNFSKHCLPPSVVQFKPMTDIPKKMRTFLLNYAEKLAIPCQGDILLSISDSEIKITNSSGMPCIYRPDG